MEITRELIDEIVNSITPGEPYNRLISCLLRDDLASTLPFDHLAALRYVAEKHLRSTGKLELAVLQNQITTSIEAYLELGSK